LSLLNSFDLQKNMTNPKGSALLNDAAGSPGRWVVPVASDIDNQAQQE